MCAGMKITISHWLFSHQLSNVATYFLVYIMLVKKAMLLYLTQNNILLLGGIRAMDEGTLHYAYGV